jgi:ribosomal protein S18 acetylase RimI-like enzyme
MILEYGPDLLPALAELHRRFAESTPGLPSFSPEHWEAIFARPGVDPRRDVLIAARGGEEGLREPAAFCWLFMKSAPERVVLRGPYLPKDDPDREELLGTLLDKASERAGELGAGYLEGRSALAEWAESMAARGFRRHGAYERRRLFPIKATEALRAIPQGGEIRQWRGISDLHGLMSLFEKVFSEHWDYIPPRRESWEEVVRGEHFDPRLVLLAFDERSAIGYAFGESMPDPVSPMLEAAYLVSFGVLRGHRRKGWARSLLWRWLRNAYDSGRRAAELDVDETNRGARILYEEFGFRYLRTEEVWRLDLSGARSVKDGRENGSVLQRTSEPV